MTPHHSRFARDSLEGSAKRVGERDRGGHQHQRPREDRVHAGPNRGPRLLRHRLVLASQLTLRDRRRLAHASHPHRAVRGRHHHEAIASVAVPTAELPGHRLPPQKPLDLDRIALPQHHLEALDHALHGTFGRSFDYLIKLIGRGRLDALKEDPAMTDDEVTVEYCVTKLAIVGDVDECTRRLHEVWTQTGGFGTLLMITHDWDDKEKWLRSMELLKNEVVPALPTI